MALQRKRKHITRKYDEAANFGSRKKGQALQDTYLDHGSQLSRSAKVDVGSVKEME